MKLFIKIILPLLLFATLVSYGQTAGINYQALIMSADTIPIPGNDIIENQVPLKAENVNFRFTITTGEATGFSYLYSEEQFVLTDDNGMVSLVVGEGSPLLGTFNGIAWDGGEKYLNVEIEIVKNGGGYSFLDSQKILFLPQSNILSLSGSNGIQIVDNVIVLGGALAQPTTIGTSNANTLSITGLQTGNFLTDNLLTIDASTGTLRQIAATTVLRQRQSVITASEGQIQFNAPLPVDDPERVDVFRNGIRIEFTALGGTSIQLEAGVVCHQNDEIRIVQLF